MKKNRIKGYTLIELIAVLVIMLMIFLIVTPLVMSIIRRARISAYKRSIDAYGRSVELAIASYLLDNGTFPTDLNSLTVEYSGSEVVCNVMAMKENGGIYLSECIVNGKEVKDSSTEDGWYHYGTRDITNEEYVDMYGDALRRASIGYYTEHETPVEDYRTLEIDYEGKNISCDVTVNYNGTIYMTNCKVNNVEVRDENEEDGYYHYGSIVDPTAVQSLIEKSNPLTTTNYIDGNSGEMYTFEHPATAQTGALTDYRYIGATPNNYVYFNDDELWRIIGVFTVEDENGNQEQRIKIIKNIMLNNNMSVHSRQLNDWPQVNLNSYLNGDYYNGLSDDAKNMIASSKYYLGGLVFDSSTHWGDGSEIYKNERGLTVYSGRSTDWTGKIALAYPSDYVYTYALGVDNKCYTDSLFLVCQNSSLKNNSWLHNTNNNTHQWLLSPYSVNERDIFLWYRVGGGANNSVTLSYGIQPSLYLSEKVKIESGDGSIDNPYRLKL